MYFVSAGSDLYGRVKSVSGTPVVTKFSMLQALPIFPLKSYYFLGTGIVERSGIPLLASSQSVEIRALPLARLDGLSVAIAYARGLFGVLFVVGCLVILPLIMMFTGERFDALALFFTSVLLLSLFTGLVGGVLTYVVPLTSSREREIRQCCGEILGAAVDPARVEPQVSAGLANYAHERAAGSMDPRAAWIVQLVAIRAQIAHAYDARQLESHTDRLLAHLRHGATY